MADVKLAQAKYLSSRLAEFRTQVSERYDCVPSVIVAGDFNSVPGDKVSVTFHFFRFLFYLFIFIPTISFLKIDLDFPSRLL